MDLFENSSDWAKKLEPILVKYTGRKHPLVYHNLYQLLVKVVLSAQDSDANINNISAVLFNAYPNMESLAKSNIEALIPYITSVKNFRNKGKWLMEIAKTIQKDDNIPLKMHALVSLKGIGRKSANVIMREFGVPSAGIIADLHVIRVAPRIGLISATKDGIKAEKQLMQVLPNEIWAEIGMAISFLGREICRPQPNCLNCPLSYSCIYFNNNQI